MMPVTKGPKREELAGVKVEWAITERPGKVKTLKQRPRKNKAVIQFERLKASIRAKVEHPFRLIKRQFGFVKARYKGADEERQSIGDAVYAGEPVPSGSGIQIISYDTHG